MKASMIALLLVGPGLIVGAVAAAGDSKDQKAAEGAWLAVAMEKDGAKVPDDAVKNLNIKLTLTGDKYTVHFGGNVAEQGTTKTDWTKKPAPCDIDAIDGPNKGKTIPCILAVEGDTLKACYNLQGSERPTAFSTKEGSGHLLITFQREKK